MTSLIILSALIIRNMADAILRVVREARAVLNTDSSNEPATGMADDFVRTTSQIFRRPVQTGYKSTGNLINTACHKPHARTMFHFRIYSNLKINCDSTTQIKTSSDERD